MGANAHAFKYGFKCSVCKAPCKHFDIHHKTYERIGNEDINDVIALCHTCHKNTHELITANKADLSTAHIELSNLYSGIRKKIYTKPVKNREKKPTKTKPVRNIKRPRRIKPRRFHGSIPDTQVIKCATGEVVVGYEAFLNTRYWAELKLRLMKKRSSLFVNGFNCPMCGNIKLSYEFHQHSNKYIGCYKRGDIVIICTDCHDEVHNSVNNKIRPKWRLKESYERLVKAKKHTLSETSAHS